MKKFVKVPITVDSKNPKHCGQNCKWFRQFCQLFWEDLEEDTTTENDLITCFRCEECIEFELKGGHDESGKSKGRPRKT
jgi:hypothetical protein